MQMILMFLINNFVKLEWLKGYRTYVIVGIFVLGNVAENIVGIDLPFFAADPDWINNLLIMLGIGTARGAIGTNTSNSDPKTQNFGARQL